MVKLFFSYSHRDEELRNELEVHLSALKRQRIIETWHDRRIGAGQEFGNAINAHLSEADIILLLVSPYFIASDYCYEKEMELALERHEAGEARVIPVILEPCDWHSLPFGKLLATPTDGKPITKFPNRHDGFLEVTLAIRQAAAELGKSSPGSPATSSPAAPATASSGDPAIRSGNLRIKKVFTDRDRDHFLTEGFEYIAKYFEQSLAELERRYPSISQNFRRIDANRFTATLYRDGKQAAHCTIALGGHGALSKGIIFSWGDLGQGNSISWNEQLSVDNDGYALFFKSMGMLAMSGVGGQQRGEKLTHQGAAELYWSAFIGPLQ